MSVTAFNSAEFPAITPWEWYSWRWFQEGKINPQVEERYKLQDATKALDKILNRGTKGKVILYNISYKY